MKITYEFADGTRSEVEVDEELGNLVIDSRTKEENANRKEARHCLSLESFDYEGIEFADPETPESLYNQAELSERIQKALASLTNLQRKRLLMLANGMSAHQIADLEGSNHKSVLESIEAAKKKFLKNF